LDVRTVSESTDPDTEKLAGASKISGAKAFAPIQTRRLERIQKFLRWLIN